MEALSRNVVSQYYPSVKVDLPEVALFDLPEKVLQFGTGVLLRALPDEFIHKANQQQVFNGRIVVIRSTDNPNTDFEQQDNLYTVSVKGLKEGAEVVHHSVNSAISRVLSASHDWQQIVEVAKNESIQLVISNTTEVGIKYQPELIGDQTPASFPAKLLALLKVRYEHFLGNTTVGWVIIPTELISDNATVLKDILLKLAQYNSYEQAFIDWLVSANSFCNSLVDRIVPGKPMGEELHRTECELGYTDALLTKAEPFQLWAIEVGDKERDILTFANVHPEIVLSKDITKFKELKLRLLNGTHSFTCAFAFLSNIQFTRESFADTDCEAFMQRLMFDEIVPSIPLPIALDEKQAYARSVIDRFANPFIDHKWLSISVQYTSKMRMRNVPLILSYFNSNNKIPSYMAFGFACYIAFLHPRTIVDQKYYGEWEGVVYEILDESASLFFNLWSQYSADQIVVKLFQHKELWGSDIGLIEGFDEKVQQYVSVIHSGGVRTAYKKLVDDQTK